MVAAVAQEALTGLQSLQQLAVGVDFMAPVVELLAILLVPTELAVQVHRAQSLSFTTHRQTSPFL